MSTSFDLHNNREKRIEEEEKRREDEDEDEDKNKNAKPTKKKTGKGGKKTGGIVKGGKGKEGSPARNGSGKGDTRDNGTNKAAVGVTTRAAARAKAAARETTVGATVSGAIRGISMRYSLTDLEKMLECLSESDWCTIRDNGDMARGFIG